MLLTESNSLMQFHERVRALSGQDLASLVAGRLSLRLMRLFMSSKVNPLTTFACNCFRRGRRGPDGLSATTHFIAGLIMETLTICGSPQVSPRCLLIIIGSFGLRRRGVWAFENFLLARYHMFLAVYLPHSGLFRQYAGRYFESGDYTLPSEPNGYLETDDIELTIHLRRSNNLWAKWSRREHLIVSYWNDTYSESHQPQKVEEIL